MMRRHGLRIASVLLPLALGACAIGDYYDKWFGADPAVKPAALVAIKPTATANILWQTNIGSAERYVFTPAAEAGAVVVAGNSGQIARLDAATGKVLARIDAKRRLSGGVGSDGRTILVGTAKGELIAFDQSGKELWQSQLTSEILSAPQSDQGVTVVRTADARIVGVDAYTGARKWNFQRTLPALTVRTHVGVVIHRGAVFAGFPGGRLIALALATGAIGWEATVALPKGATELERVADISSIPVHDDKQICAAAFQGRVACFDLIKGTPIWARDISSVSGLVMDGRNVYVSDEKSAVVAFDKTSGASVWKQDKLYGRRISGPLISGRFVIVADYQGHVHALSREDGSFAARIATDGSAIVAQPLAVDNLIIVQTRNGGVFAIAIQ